MDSLFIEAIINELRKNLLGARISKIHQPSPETLIFKLWNGRETLRLLLSVAAGRSRIHLTRHSYPNPPAPARFCQLLRARVSSLLALEQVPGERVVRLVFSAANSSATQPKAREVVILVAELIAHHGNLVLLDHQGRIIDALKRFEGDEGQRKVLPGREYEPLPAPDGFLMGDEAIAVPPGMLDGKEFESWLLREVYPMSRLTARDLGAAVEKGMSPDQALERFRQNRGQRENHFFTATFEGRPVLSAYAPCVLELENADFFPSPSLAADDYYGKPAEQNDGTVERRLLQTAIGRHLKRLVARRNSIETEQKEADRADELRQIGELMLAHLHLLKTGMSSVQLENYYIDPPVPISIPLDPRLTPRENAEKYFKRYKKLKRSREHMLRRLMETVEERNWLEMVALALEESENAEDLAAVRQELVEGGVLRRSGSSSPGRKASPDPGRRVREIVSPGGYRLYWGTGNRANDHVTRNLCRSHDLWFHALNLPGCHLVLKKDQDEEVSLAEQLFAASLAAGYSRGKSEGKVDVMVTEGKWVKKPKGARPGLVSVSQFRTLRVAPERLNG